MHRRNVWKKVLISVYAFLILLVFVGPFVWIVITSISPERELTAIPIHWFPREPTLDNYKNLIFGGVGTNTPIQEFLTSVWNSIQVASLTTLICLIAGSTAAYAFARLKFRGRDALLVSTIFLQMLPTIVIIIPLYLLMAKLSMLNKISGLVLVYCSFTLPFVIWVMKGYFQTIPKELEEAARIDGCSRLGVLLRIVLPLSLPGLVATAIFSLLGAWSEFLIAVVFTSSVASKTIPVVISEFAGQYSLDYGMMAAAAVIASIPPVIFGLLTQKYIVGGLTSGAVKG